MLQTPLKLFTFQEDTVGQILYFLKEKNKERSCYCALEMGLGKTICAIRAAKYLNAENILIICPAIMRYTWEAEIMKWGVSADIDVILASKQTLLYKKYTIVSYDIARSDVFINKLPAKIDLLILDESHYIKTRKTKRAVAILEKIWHLAAYRLALSGTPFTQSVADGYTLFNKMLPEKFTNYYSFINEYAYQKPTPWGVKIIGARNTKKLSKIIKSNFYIRLKKDEVLKDLPPKIYTEIKLGAEYLLKTTKEENDRLETDIADYAKTAVVPHSLAEHRRLQAELKVPAIAEFASNLLENNIPVVLFAYHREFIRKLSAALAKFKPVIITGDTSAKDRFDYVEAFQEAKTNLFIGQFTAAGTGITLTRASHVILAELDWSPAVINQSVDRLHRIGQKNSVNIYYFVVKDSLEEYIVKVLINKTETFKAVLDRK